MNELIEKIKKARFIWICGNGGSAATAEHFTTDLVKKGYPAICLNSNMSVITMIANDYGYDTVFSKQLALYGNKEDLLITISCSGKSRNILNALLTAVNKDIDVYKLPTFDDTMGTADYGTLEDTHLEICHDTAKAL